MNSLMSWLLLLNIMSSKICHVVAYSKFVFFISVKYSTVEIHPNLLIHSTVAGVWVVHNFWIKMLV